MFVALASLLTARPVRSDVAMTGEISLRGLVLPIGGVKEKVLAALRAGISTVILPARNRRDLEEIPSDARDKLEFVWVERVDDALATALSAEPAPARIPHHAIRHTSRHRDRNRASSDGERHLAAWPGCGRQRFRACRPRAEAAAGARRTLRVSACSRAPGDDQ
jgi:hypothetical protein